MLKLHEHVYRTCMLLLEDARGLVDSMDGGGGGLCFPRGLGSLYRIESGKPDTNSTAAGYSHSDTTSGKGGEGRPGQPGPEARIPDHQDAFSWM
ncbi:hypothetical protein Tco_0917063 [Tanacetum coccineum]